MKSLFLIFAFSLISTSPALSKPLTFALNWKAEPEFGGFYAAQLSGFYKKQGLDISIQEGGSGTPTIQMLANGKVDFAIVSADEIIISQERNPKSKIIAVYSVYETSPHIILTHQDREFTSLQDVFQSPGTLAVQSGLPYYQWLIKKWGRPKAKVVPFTGGIAHFLNDQNFSQQGFITTELIGAQRAGKQVKHFLIADEGYNPYLVVVAVRESTLKEQPELVKKFVTATRQGWESYLSDPSSTNHEIAKLNKAFDLETLKLSAEVQIPLIKSPKTELGTMSEDRWKQLSEQLLEIGLIKKASPPNSYFKNL